MRVLVGVVLALGLCAPVVLAASPAFATGCTATVSDPYPAQNETVTVSFVGPANTSATAVAHYRTVDNTNTTTTDANGHGAVGFNTGAAPYGETVVVDVVVGSASCSTSFDPRAPSGTTTTTVATSSTSTTSTTAVLTGLGSAAVTTTTVRAAVAASTATVAAASAPSNSSLAFTGNATAIEAAAGALLLGLGAFFLGSARRRKELARLLWPDER